MLKHLFAWMMVVIAIAGISGGLTLYKQREFEAANAAAAQGFEPAAAVVTVRARKGSWSATSRAIGTVVAQRQIELRNELPGAIAEMGFKSGDIVEAGQTLVQLDVRQEQASLAAAQAEARLTKLTLDRKQSLQGSPAFSAQDVDKSREEFAAADARAQSLSVIIDKKKVVAPFRARVGITNLQPGAYLDAGTVIGRIQGIDADAYVDFNLPQDSAAAIKAGSTVTVTGAGIPGGSASAKIVAEDDSVDGGSRAIRFRAVLSGLGEAIRPGTFVDVTAVVSTPREAVMVPLTALRRSPSGQHVFVIIEEDGKTRARERPVQTGPVQEQDIAIEKGLAVGELVAAQGSFKLRDGALVQSDASQASTTTN